jgi:type IV secretory pathway TraG/TraD family ATPase VirD4
MTTTPNTITPLHSPATTEPGSALPAVTEPTGNEPALGGREGGTVFWSGIPLGYTFDGTPLHAGTQHGVLVIGPPRSGKTLGIVVPAIATAPGPVVATSTKPDLLHYTAGARWQHGRCWYFDPSGTTTPPHWATPLRWSPLQGCTDWRVAVTRAHALSAATAEPGTAGMVDGGHWKERAEALLAPLLHAAALLNADMGTVIRWVLTRNTTEPLQALRAVGSELAGQTLVGIAETEERERSGIFSTTARTLTAYRNPHALAAANHPNFNPDEFVTTRDTVYLVAPAAQQNALAPIIVCLLDHIRHTTYTHHANTTDQPGPPMAPVLFALDEVANIAPLPDLPSIVAEGGSQGLVTLACLQDLNQARTRWGTAADGFFTLFAAKIALGGIADRTTLAALSYLAGTHDVTYRTQNNSGGRTGWSQHIQQRPRIPPEQINTIPPGVALLAHTNHPPTYVALTPPLPPRPARTLIDVIVDLAAAARRTIRSILGN